MELIQMTAAYSNAVLMAILPHVTDVAKNLDLPILQPVQPAHVWRFFCDPRKGSIGGWLTLTNGYQFWYDYGNVRAMESPHCYFSLQDPDEIPRFYGTMRMTEAEAVQMAQQTIRKLGYRPSWLKTDQPNVERAQTPLQDMPKVIPHFRIRWQRIALDGRKTIAEVEINADAKRPERYWLLGREFERKPPNIPRPPVIWPPPSPPPPVSESKLKRLPENQRVAATNDVCAKATEMVKRLGLPIKLPIRPQNIKESHLDIWEGDLSGSIILKSGYRFGYEYGHIEAFYSPNSDSYEHAFDLRTVYGKVRYTKEQILDFATKQVRKLGYPDSAIFLDQPASVGGGPSENAPGYTRFRVRWQRPGTKSILDDPGAQFTLAEVNGMTLQLESLWLRSTNLFQPSVIKPGATNKYTQKQRSHITGCAQTIFPAVALRPASFPDLITPRSPPNSAGRSAESPRQSLILHGSGNQKRAFRFRTTPAPVAHRFGPVTADDCWRETDIQTRSKCPRRLRTTSRLF